MVPLHFVDFNFQGKTTSESQKLQFLQQPVEPGSISESDFHIKNKNLRD